MYVNIMPYYGLFLPNILYTDLHWILPCSTLICVDITPVHTTFMFHDSLWHHNG